MLDYLKKVYKNNLWEQDWIHDGKENIVLLAINCHEWQDIDNKISWKVNRFYESIRFDNLFFRFLSSSVLRYSNSAF